MILSKTTEYALRILTLMVQQEVKFSSDEFYRQLGIPKKYLQRLLTLLSKEGLIVSTRGKKGGYTLAKKPETITLANIVQILQGLPPEPKCFFGFEKCLLNEPCVMHSRWDHLQTEILHTLETTKLSDLIRTS